MILLILPLVLAIDLSVEKLDAQDTIIKGLDSPAKINIRITNNGDSGVFSFYNLLGFIMEPNKSIEISKGSSKEVQLVIYPRKDLDVKNYYNFQYFIRGSNKSEQEEKVILKIIELGDAFEVGADELDPEASSLNVYIHNKEDIDFKDLKVRFYSNFFDFEEEFDLGAHEREDFSITLNKDDFKELTAGFYTLNADVTYMEKQAISEGVIKFVEKDVVESTEKDFGWIVATKIIKKTNQGNTIISADTIVEKNVLSRLFTSFEPEPDAVNRERSTVFYTWSQEIRPGQTLEIKVKTNWLYPFLIIIFIVIIVVIVKQSVTNDVQIRKRVSYVKAKGGQFALKVTLYVFSRKYVERVNIVDRLPSLMKVYERFGGEKPSRINQKARMIEWDFEKLEAGEMRTISYIIYSKDVGVMGKFALPSATAIYQRLGKVKESTSNKAFFVSEQRTRDVEYY